MIIFRCKQISLETYTLTILIGTTMLTLSFFWIWKEIQHSLDLDPHFAVVIFFLIELQMYK